MNIDYENFKQELRQKLLVITKYPQSKIWFGKREINDKFSEDRLYIVCKELDKEQHICAIYTEELYTLYNNGTKIQQIADDILTEIENLNENPFYDNPHILEEYDKIKDNLFVRAINYDRNAFQLTDSYFYTIGDIALVLCLKLGDEKGNFVSAKVPRKFTQNWNIDKETLFKEALSNTYSMAPPRIYRWERMLFSPEYDGDNFMDCNLDFNPCPNQLGCCISNTRKLNGAVSIFLPNVAKRLSVLLNDDFYIVCTSQHELMAHPAKTITPTILKHILDDTTTNSVHNEDILTNHIYYYDRTTSTISCAV